MKKFADVILPLPLHSCFTYSLPDEWADEVQTGCRVVVPFGRKKYYTAIVRNVHYCAPTEYEVKEVSALLDARPILLPRQFKFWEWLSDYYLCTQGDVYKAALPSGLKLESETIVEYNPDFESDVRLPEKEQKILDMLSADPEQCVTKLEKETGIKNILSVIKSLLDKEAIFVKEELRRTYKPKTETRVRLTAAARNEHRLHIFFDELQRRAPKQLDLLMKYLELSGYLSGRDIKEVSKAELLQRTSTTPAVSLPAGNRSHRQSTPQRSHPRQPAERAPATRLSLHLREFSKQERLPATWCHGKRQDRSLYSSDRRNHPARKAGALSPARNSPHCANHRAPATRFRFPSGHLPLQVPRCGTGGNLAEAAVGSRL